MTENTKIIWLTKSEDHDYQASLSYLGLIFGNKSAKKYIDYILSPEEIAK